MKAITANRYGPPRPEHAAYVRALGAAETIDHTSKDVAGQALRRHPGGVDALLDAAGLGDRLPEIAAAVRDQGRIISVLTAPGPAAFGRGLDVSTVYVSDAEPGQLRALADSVADGRLTVTVSRTYPLRDAATAIADVHRTREPGKLVVTIA